MNYKIVGTEQIQGMFCGYIREENICGLVTRGPARVFNLRMARKYVILSKNYYKFHASNLIIKPYND